MCGSGLCAERKGGGSYEVLPVEEMDELTAMDLLRMTLTTPALLNFVRACMGALKALNVSASCENSSGDEDQRR